MEIENEEEAVEELAAALLSSRRMIMLDLEGEIHAGTVENVTAAEDTHLTITSREIPKSETLIVQNKLDTSDIDLYQIIKIGGVSTLMPREEYRELIVQSSINSIQKVLI